MSNDLINESAEIMGGVWPSNPDDDTVRVMTLGYAIGDWNPLTNANHTKLLKDKAVELGFVITTFQKNGVFKINIVHNDFSIIKEGQDELHITTEAINKAVKKLKETT